MFTARSLQSDDAPTLCHLYEQTPRYFEIISIELPPENDVRLEIETALRDKRRSIEFIYCDDPLLNPFEPVAYLDLKHDYPSPGNVTINLLLIPEPLQSRGLGTRIIRWLEARLRGRAQRALASVYGHNSLAARFWERLGYVRAIDARPLLEWYAKSLTPNAREPFTPI